MSLRRYIPLAAVAALAAVPAGASAHTGHGVTVETSGAQAFEGGLVALAGDRINATARTTGAAPGSTLTLTFVQGGRTVRTVKATVTGAGEVNGTVSRPPGLLTVRGRLTEPTASTSAANGGSSAEAQAPAPAAAAEAPNPARITVMEPRSEPGARGLRVRFLQSRLAALGFAVPRHGNHDYSTANAVIAHRKVLGLARVGAASATQFRAAAEGRGAYTARFPLGGRHVEADLTRQVLALVEPGGKVVAVYHTSSGRPRFKTPTGVHRFWRKEFGLNSRGMLHTVYFTRDKTTRPTRPACGIHGYFVVPTFAASHCCFRVPMGDALTIYRWTRVGERIYVYRS